MRSILLGTPFALLAAPAMAQEHDNELWLTGQGQVAIDKKTRIETEFVSRMSDDSGGLYEIELAGGLQRTIGDGFNIGGGYVRTVNYSRGRTTRTEDRWRIQAGWSGSVGKVKLSTRARLEHRSRSDGDEIGYRLRPQVKASLPIGGPYSLFASHESFIPLDDTDWGQRAGYERMRNAVGLGWKATDELTVEVGYLNQYNFSRNRDPDVMDHAAAVTLAVSL